MLGNLGKTHHILYATNAFPKLIFRNLDWIKNPLAAVGIISLLTLFFYQQNKKLLARIQVIHPMDDPKCTPNKSKKVVCFLFAAILGLLSVFFIIINYRSLVSILKTILLSSSSDLIILSLGCGSILGIAVFCILIGLKEGNNYFKNWVISKDIVFAHHVHLKVYVVHQKKGGVLYLHNHNEPSSFSPFGNKEEPFLIPASQADNLFDIQEDINSTNNKLASSARNQGAALIIARKAQNNTILMDCLKEQKWTIFLKKISDCLVLIKENEIYVGHLSADTKDSPSQGAQDMLKFILGNSFLTAGGGPSFFRSSFTRMPSPFQGLFLMGILVSFLYLGVAGYLLWKRRNSNQIHIYPLLTSIPKTQINSTIALTDPYAGKKSILAITITGESPEVDQEHPSPTPINSGNTTNVVFTEPKGKNKTTDNILLESRNSFSNLILVSEPASAMKLCLENISQCIIFIKDPNHITVRRINDQKRPTRDLKIWEQEITDSFKSMFDLLH